jgi:ABC-type nitrate/sulfonate/bicarbonate transport system substrate-binding protein
MRTLRYTTKVVSLALIVWFGIVSKAQTEPLVIGYSAVTSVFLPFWIGKEAGFYKKEGLDAQLVYIASSTTMAQAMSRAKSQSRRSTAAASSIAHFKAAIWFSWARS